MAKLHELLAAEASRKETYTKLLEETRVKFIKSVFFRGYVKVLKMIKEDPSNEAIEKAGSEAQELRTTVPETLEYFLASWVKYEDLKASLNATNATATADLLYKGEVILEDLPVDEYLGLAERLGKIKALILDVPTLDASKAWTPIPASFKYKSAPENTLKTDKVVTPVVLYPHSDKHPAQVEKVSKDVPVGTATTVYFSGEITAEQKAEMITIIDELIVEAQAARQRCNAFDVVDRKVGDALIKVITSPLKKHS